MAGGRAAMKEAGVGGVCDGPASSNQVQSHLGM